MPAELYDQPVRSGPRELPKLAVCRAGGERHGVDVSGERRGVTATLRGQTRSGSQIAANLLPEVANSGLVDGGEGC
jgi:hypothetical protein